MIKSGQNPSIADPAPISLEGKSLLAGLPPRPQISHKGDFGAVGVLGGAKGMTGAVVLTSTAALFSGAGRVWASFLDSSIPPSLLTAYHPELMTAAPQDLLNNPHMNTLCVGPGMGLGLDSQELLEQSLSFPGVLILDADALNLVAQSVETASRLKARQSPTILTPHPGEAARLLNLEQISDRPAAARCLALTFNALVVLKGANSLIANPGGECWMNPSGNPALAAPGMGDTLTGLIGGLAAQGLPPLKALQIGVFVHGIAADRLLSRGIGPRGLTASELTLEIRAVLNASGLKD